MVILNLEVWPAWNNDSFPLLCWVTCKRHSCFLLNFVDGSYRYLASSRAGTTAKWGHPSTEVLSPSTGAGPQSHLPGAYGSWSIMEVRRRFLRHVPSSPMAEEGSRNGPSELAPIMLGPWNALQKQLATPSIWVSVKPRGLNVLKTPSVKGVSTEEMAGSLGALDQDLMGQVYVLSKSRVMDHNQSTHSQHRADKMGPNSRTGARGTPIPEAEQSKWS